MSEEIWENRRRASRGGLFVVAAMLHGICFLGLSGVAPFNLLRPWPAAVHPDSAVVFGWWMFFSLGVISLLIAIFGMRPGGQRARKP